MKKLVFGALGLLAVVVGAVGQTTQPLVAIHDSELTRALQTMPASGATPTGAGTTGFQWWPTNWNYFVMPESVEEALRSDGTAFVVVKDADISAGRLLNANGTPKYPIMISLASEAIRDDEIGPLTNYVAAGGTLLVGSSAFTRNPDGTSRGDFAIASQMGVHMPAPTLANWGYNQTFLKNLDHRIVSHIPSGVLGWRMPSAADEISLGVSPNFTPPSGHLLWQVTAGGSSVVASGDNSPYLVVNNYGQGRFIYDASMQPLIGHGGFQSGMYAYVIFRKSIEWAFESARLSVPKVSPWPFPYDAAAVFRHDEEDFPTFINTIESSAQYENSVGAKGDYFFCTGALWSNYTATARSTEIASIKRAMTLYGATIGSHNGGLPNPYNHSLVVTDYDYWHWGPDECLDFPAPPGYASSAAYALASVSKSFADLAGWGFTNSSGLRLWACPSFNSTREASYDILQQVGAVTAGEEKLSCFPHWRNSTIIDGKRYPFLVLPVSDWYVGTAMAQDIESGHNAQSVQDLIDFYYNMGALINLYAHSPSDGSPSISAGPNNFLVTQPTLEQENVTYTMTKPRVWSANALGIYGWALKRTNMAVVPSFSSTGDQSITTLAVSGAADPNAAVEVLTPDLEISGLQVLTNGVTVAAGTGYRINGQVVKVLVGTSVTNVQVKYLLGPTAQPDAYAGFENAPLSAPAPGVLGNDLLGTGGGALTAILASGPTNGSLTLNADGSFTYAPNAGFVGNDAFTYQATDGSVASSPATVTISIYPSVSPGTCVPPPSGLIGWWPGDGAATNYFGTNNGALQGGATASAAGEVGLAFGMNGSSAFVQVPDSSFLKPTNLTVEAWVNFSSLNSSGNASPGEQYIVFKQNSRSGNFEGFFLGKARTGGGDYFVFSATSAAGTSAEVDSAPGIQPNVWYHVAGMRGPNFLQLYINGQLVGQTSISFPQDYGTFPMYFGTSGQSYWDGKFSGTLDEVSLYNRALSSNEVAAIYLAGSGGKCKGSLSIASQPQSQSVAVGNPAIFNVTANGGAPLSYQWRFNGSTISGATTTMLTLNNVQTFNAGNYTVVVTNTSGSVTSAVAVLTVLTPPLITTQPVGQTNVAGSTLNLSASASGSTPLGYQWLFNGAGLANGGRVSGATSPALAISGVQSTDGGNYALVVSNAVGVVTSAVASVTVLGPPVITGPPASQSVVAGASASFNVTATGTPPLSYQWRWNGGGLAGASGSSLTLNNVQPANAGNYTVVVTNSAGSVTSAVAVLTVIVPPSLSSQPLSQTNVLGSTASFSAGASGTAPLSYQWRFNGANLANGGRLSGVSSSALSISGVQSSDAGGYALVVSNSGGAVTSAVAVLTVLVPPSLSVQPTNQSVAAGSTVSFNVGATGTMPLSYQWLFNGAALSDGSQFGGSATASLSINNVQGTNAGGYSVVVTNVAGSVTSAVAALSVSVPGSCDPPPSGLVGWWTGDGNATNYLGTNNGTLQGGATASAVGMVGQCFSLDGTNGYVSVADSAILRPTNVTIEAWVNFSSLDTPGTASVGEQYIVFKQNSQSGNFEGYFLGKARGANGDYFVFGVSSPAGVSAEADSTPGLQTGVWYHVAAVRGTNFLQLYVNGQLVSQSSVGFPLDYGTLPLYFGTSGQSFWDRKFAGLLDEVSIYSRALSAAEILAIYNAGSSGKCKLSSGLAITGQPQSQTVAVGSNPAFNVTANGSGTLSYQWRFNGSTISGATTTMLALNNVQTSNAGNYTVVVTNTSGSVTSAVAVLTVLTPPLITTQPVGQTNVAGSTLNLSASASGSTPLGYQWLFNGAGLANGGRVSGATSPALAISGVQSTDGGNYALVVSNAVGVVTSAVASVTVLGPPVITGPPASQSVVAGASASFNVTATGTPPLSYQWRWNGGGLAGASGSSLTLNNVQPANAGNYTVVVTNSAGSVTSAVAVLTVIVPPSLSSQPLSQTNVLGSTASFSAGASGTAPLSYQWRFNGANLANGGRLSGVSSSALSISGVQSSDAGGYALVVSNSGGAVTSAVAVLTVLVPPSLSVQPTNQSVAAGSTVSFNVGATGTMPLSYQWLFNGAALSDGSQFGGSATASLSINNVQGTNAGGYSVVVTNVAGSVTSAVAALSVSVPGSCDPPPSGLVGWWTGDGNATNYLGTNNGTLQGGATASAVGMVGQCFSLDGTNGYVSVADSAILRPTNVTIEAWVNFSSLDTPGTASVGEQYIVFKQNSQSGNFEGYFLGKARGANGDYFVFGVSSPAGVSAEADSTPGLQTGVWYHVAAVRGTNFLQLYVNGQLVSQSSVGFPLDYGTLPLYFGTSGQSFWDRKFAGLLDEVSIYSRALSAAEILAIYNAGSSGKCKGPGGALVVSESVEPAKAGVNGLGSADHSVKIAGSSVPFSGIRQPSIQSVVLKQDTAVITWSASTGSLYRVQFCDDLGRGNWTDLQPDVQAAGPTASATDHLGHSAQRFYRILLVK